MPEETQWEKRARDHLRRFADEDKEGRTDIAEWVADDDLAVIEAIMEIAIKGKA